MKYYEVYIAKEDIVDKKHYTPYNINASNTFTNIIRFFSQESEFEKALLSKDSLIVNDGNKDIKADEFYFAYVDDGYNKFAGSIGFNMKKTIVFPEQSMNFIDQLKNNSIISGYSLTIKFDSNYKGKLFIGPDIDQIIPEEINDYKKQVIKASGEGFIKTGRWELDLNRVLVGESELFSSKKIHFDLAYDFIVGTDEFTEFISKNFFSSLFGTEKCIKEKIPSSSLYLGIKCLKSVNVKNFPDLKFDLSTDFEKFYLVMDYRDLFEEKGEYNYFKILIANNEISTITINSEWIFGKEFFKMNLITFNKDRKDITIYYKEKQKKEENGEAEAESNNKSNKNIILLWVLVVVLIIMAGVIAYLLLKCIKQGKIIKRRSRLNILEDELTPEE